MPDLLPHLVSEPGPPPDAAVIWLHGLGADGYDFVNLLPQLDLPANHRIRFIFPHAPKIPVSINAGMLMPAWHDLSALGAEIKADPKGVELSRQSINAFIKAQRADGIPADRIVLAGFSQGGATALHAGLHADETLAGILALSAYVPLPDALAPTHFPPVYMAHGKQDPVVLPERATASRDLLKEKKVEVDFRLYDMPHSLCPMEINDICHQLRVWLPLK